MSQDHSRANGPQVKDKVKARTAAAVKVKEIIVRRAVKEPAATDQAKAAVLLPADKVLVQAIVHRAAKAAIARQAVKEEAVRQVKAAPDNVRALAKAAIAAAAVKTVPLAADKIAPAKAAAQLPAVQEIVRHQLLRKDKAAALIPEVRSRAQAQTSARTKQEAETDKNASRTAAPAVLEETATEAAKAEASSSNLRHGKKSTIHRKKLLSAAL